MNELGMILLSIRYSNECTVFGHKQCDRYGRITQICLGELLDLRSYEISRIEHGGKLIVEGAEKLCGVLGLDVVDFAESVSRFRGFVERAPVGKRVAANKYRPTRQRFGEDLRKARVAIKCENGCCLDHISIHHAGEMVGISGSIWRAIEFNRKRYTFELYLQLCGLMGLDPHDYVGESVAGGGGDLVGALRYLEDRNGRLSFGVSGDGAVTVFVPGCGARSGDTIVEAVAWMKRDVGIAEKLPVASVLNVHSDKVA